MTINGTERLPPVRAGNIVGGGDWAKDRLVPDIMTAFLYGRPVIIRNPTAIRSWQHVLDPLSGYSMLAERLWHEGPAFAEGWNCGPSDEDARLVERIVQQLVRAWGSKAAWNMDQDSRPHEARLLKFD